MNSRRVRGAGEIEAEFDRVFSPLLTLPEGQQAAYKAKLDADPRYRITTQRVGR